MRQKIGAYQERGAKRSRGKRRCHKTYVAIKLMLEGRYFEAGLLGAYDTSKGPNLSGFSLFSKNIYI